MPDQNQNPEQKAREQIGTLLQQRDESFKELNILIYMQEVPILKERTTKSSTIGNSKENI
jgi:hypothetical protein